jgi:hypothetical protein
LAKYYVYVTAKGEEGSIESKVKEIIPYNYHFKCECWKCGDVAEASNERKSNT